MARQEAGKWKPYNVKAIVNNVKLVFKSRNINKLNNPAYHFISLHMGFIAHYSLYGFRDSYEDLEDFAKRLQTSEYSREDYDYTLKQAKRQESDSSFDLWYGPAYNKSIAEAIRGIVEVARKYYPGRGTMPMLDPDADYHAYANPVTVPGSRSKTKAAKRPGATSGVRGLR